MVLAVFFPFAAAGLWMLASWGPVIWFICAVTETVMYAGFPELFGHHRRVKNIKPINTTYNSSSDLSGNCSQKFCGNA